MFLLLFILSWKYFVPTPKITALWWSPKKHFEPFISAPQFDKFFFLLETLENSCIFAFAPFFDKLVGNLTVELKTKVPVD